LFFVLSGYLITSRLIDLQSQKNSLRKFYTNRALRILPLYFLTLIVFYIGYNLLVRKQNFYLFEFYNHSWWSFLFFLQNWSFIFYNGFKENFLGHFWSLAVEEQFYLIWPFFLYLFFGRGNFHQLIFTAILLIIATRILLYIKYPEWSDYEHYYYNTFCRMDSFLIGGILFISKSNSNGRSFIKYYLAALLIVIFGIYLTGSASFANPFISTIGYTLIGLISAGLVDTAVSNSNKLLSAVFNGEWLKFTGKISYGLYIFHWLVLKTFKIKISNSLVNSFHINIAYADMISLFSCLAISFIISIISYFYFETWFLKRKFH
jgi:peptidoglycan/LPS O-acetylase OafA/YrhL